MSVKEKLGKSTIREVSNLYLMHIRTVQRIWKQAKDTPAGVLVDVSQRRKNRCGRKKIPIDIQRIIDTPLHRRTILCTLAETLGISYVTLYKRVKYNIENKVVWLRFCLSMLDPHSLNHEPKFIDMYNIVHNDEKWFYMTKRKENHYLFPKKKTPYGHAKERTSLEKL